MESTQIKKPDYRELLHAASGFVLELYNRFQNPRLVFHDFGLAETLALTVREIAQAEDLDPEAAAVSEIAAWFLPAGYLLDYGNPLNPALREVRHFFQLNPCPETFRVRIVQCLQTILSKQPQGTVEERLLRDAYVISGFIRDGENRLSLLRLEWELMEGRALEKINWLEIQREYLLQWSLFYRHSKVVYQSPLSLLILDAQRALDKEMRREPPETAPSGRFHFLEPDSPVRAAQTFFRANYRNHINLSSIADNKANIMISVNSIMISVLITFLSYRNIAEVKPLVLLPVIIFLVTGLASLIFAVLSARPKVTSLNQGKKDPVEIRKNLVFFGNFISLDLDDYEEAMDEMFRNTELLYGNMTRDLYHLGKVLDKKYRYLTVSYNLFMVGFVATVLTFLVVLFS